MTFSSDMTPGAPTRVIVLGAPGLPGVKGESPKVMASFADQDARTGAPVLGTMAKAATDLVEALRKTEADSVVWAVPPPDRALARKVLSDAAAEGRRVYMAAEGALRPLQLDDLFPTVSSGLDAASIAKIFNGKRVLVTGGGGSIGGQLLRRLAAVKPSRLTALDISEHGLFIAQNDPMLQSAHLSTVLCDVADADELLAVVQREKPDIIFHAAAVKHVPMAEAHPSRAAKINILGTRNVAEAAASVNADLVFVSTDKAVHPRSVMGATKRLAGLYCRALDAAGPGRMRRLVVRLGNVLGSAGSAAPLFERQLAAGQPITITHPDAERFFVTLDQAAECLLQAAAAGLKPRAPRGLVYVPEMGDPVAIVDLAHDVIRLAGKDPSGQSGITVIGLRPGEKLNELLVAEEEEPVEGSPVRAVRSSLPTVAELEAHIARILAAARAGDDATVKRSLESAVAYRKLARLAG